MAVLRMLSRNCSRALLRSWLAKTALGAAVFSLHSPAVALAQQGPVSQWALTNTSVDVDTSSARQQIEMVINTSREITADQSFKRVRIQNPNVLTAIPLEGGNRLQISAVATGVTQVDLLGADDSVHTIQVMVLGDVRELESILQKAFPSANLAVMPIQGGCVLSGYVANDEDVQDAMTIAGQYFPTVVNRITVAGVHTIQLEIQVMEVSRTKLRALGIDWALANGDDAIASTVTGLMTATGTTFAGGGSETFSVGVVENSTTFFTAIQALRRNSLVKVLATPTLTAIDGRPASFNAGGEFPIVVPAGLGQVGVQFREFGTRLDFVANVKSNGKIHLEVRPYVSEIDPGRSVTIQGVSVPGLRSRFLETGVEMGAGQTLALGGLLQLKNETVSLGVPGLADMPWVGALFRSTREEQNEIELLITVTPNFAGPMDPCEIPAAFPGSSTQVPTDRELFWNGYLEVPVTGADCADGSMGMPGMIQSLPEGYPAGPVGEGAMQYGNVQYGNVQYGNVQYGNVQPPLPVPNPAAMSVGPNAPKLVNGQQTNMSAPPYPSGANIRTASGQQPTYR